MSHNNQKKALINDFTGFGRCSIAVAPSCHFYAEGAVLSAADVGAVKSYRAESFFFDDYAEKMTRISRSGKSRPSV